MDSKDFICFHIGSKFSTDFECKTMNSLRLKKMLKGILTRYLNCSGGAAPVIMNHHGDKSTKTFADAAKACRYTHHVGQ